MLYGCFDLLLRCIDFIIRKYYIDLIWGLGNKIIVLYFLKVRDMKICCLKGV